MCSLATTIKNIWTSHKEPPQIFKDKSSSESCSIQNEIPIENAGELRFAILSIGLYFRKDFEEAVPDVPRDYIKLLYICMENENQEYIDRLLPWIYEKHYNETVKKDHAELRLENIKCVCT